ncbi:ectonucleotide pyrophosphatase/phosphodiesterase [Paucihalobacter sp.]|uniref:alkaline phosphatase family protein n=1 Tax=Paucihalobacter sp. TaxID=2850405 RepID=UPI003D160C7A
MIKQKFVALLIIIISIVALKSCSKKTLSVASVTKSTAKIANTQPYLILISLDGFRWDYLERFKPPNLSSFANNGVKSAGLVPVFPTKTFPNHYTIVTGMYPDNHGLINNVFYDYQQDKIFSSRNRETSLDGRFYGGSPIWIEANKADLKTASFFFVGSDADIQGMHPTYYYKFDNSIKNEVRIAQALNWLRLDEKDRPQLITLYFGDADSAGHRFGTDNEEELNKAILEIDTNLGNLFEGVAAIGLPVNIIIVSDHGMINQSTDKLIPVESIQNDDLFLAIDNGSMVNIHPKKEESVDSVFQYLKQRETNFKVYKTAETPGFEYTPTHKNWGAFQLIPDEGFYFANQPRIETLIKNNVTTTGVHGLDSKHREMHGIFYAKGPAFKKDYEIAAFKSIHVFPLMCKLLGLEIPEFIVGDINQIKEVLKDGY